MRIVGLHTEHDGAVAVVDDGRLVHYVEAQKDNQRRYSELSAHRVDAALGDLDGDPDVLAVGGWFGRDGGYHGCDESVISVESGPVRRFATSHERAHVFCAYGLSPFEQGRPCYALVYDGDIGTFCGVDEKGTVTRIATPLSEPGHRYAFLYELAHREHAGTSRGLSYGVAGKLMALAGVAGQAQLEPAERDLLRFLLEDFDSASCSKDQLCDRPFWNGGHLDAGFRAFARIFSDALFDRFLQVARAHLSERRPLLIAGGCGLNCDWNSRWLSSGLFEDVFVPPCTDDSGIALGAAIDAQRHFTGSAKVAWDVYAGEPFRADAPAPEGFVHSPAAPDAVARLLSSGAIVAWVQGRYEIGPRALGNRSILAAPFLTETRDRLNRIKERERYRPVAPVCLDDETDRWFEGPARSPHMLYFHRVRSPRLAAVTHDDGSARVQTVGERDNAPLHRLLGAFSARTGVGVLCNTSLNFPGRGFINRMSDLARFATERGLDAMVVDDALYTRRAQ